jgi:hypothetical protein
MCRKRMDFVEVQEERLESSGCRICNYISFNRCDGYFTNIPGQRLPSVPTTSQLSRWMLWQRDTSVLEADLVVLE